MVKRGNSIPLIHGLLLAALALSACEPRSAQHAALLTTSISGEHPRINNAPAPPTSQLPPAKPAPIPSTGGNNPAPEPQTPPVPAQPAAPPTSGGTGGGGTGGGGFVPPAPSAVSGLVAAPTAMVISNNGSAILSNNGATIISNNGSTVISNNGSAIISNNGSTIISNNGGTYRLMDASGPESYLANAFMYLTSRDEKFYFNTQTNLPFVTTTNSSGQYSFPIDTSTGFPVDKDVIVNAALNGNLRFTGYMHPSAGGTSMKLNPASTLVTEFLRGEAYRLGKSLADFDLSTYLNVVSLTDTAITAGDISAIATVTDQTSQTVKVGTFDFRIDHLADLRNQYVIAISAVDAGKSTIKAISDAWKTLLGARPTAVTSLVGKEGGMPTIGATFATYGFADGDQRVVPAAPAVAPNTGPGVGTVTAPAKIPLGYNYGVCTSKGGDIFLSCYTSVPFSGHIRWIHPDGRVTSLWLPTYPLGTPTGLCVEKDAPAGQTLDAVQETADHGTLLVADPKFNTVIRVPIIDHAYWQGGVSGSAEVYRMDAVAGDSDPNGPGGIAQYYPDMYADHPGVVDGAGTYAATDGLLPKTSNWRAYEEGPRTYRVGNATHPQGSAVPNPARYARLDSPNDVKVDELGNVYICDQWNHRIRFIPSAQAIALKTNYFNYHAPVTDTNGYVTGFDPNPTPMQAGCMYTIVGNPIWDTTRASTQTNSKWFGEFDLTTPNTGTLLTAGESLTNAYQAQLDQPYGIAVHTEGADTYLYIAELDNQRVRRVSRNTGTIATFAGNPSGGQQSNGHGDYNYQPNQSGDGGDGGPATLARLSSPKSIAFDAQGRCFINDADSGRIRMVDANGIITTVAGRLHGPSIVATDNATDGQALRWVDLYQTEKLCVDPQGNILFNDLQHQRLRKLWRQWE